MLQVQKVTNVYTDNLTITETRLYIL